ncbi:MAG: DUF3841 domain-containing protein [Clostridia bacterium]|nr:DUF3841 domain-containing protein [Clostridia bacterium]
MKLVTFQTLEALKELLNTGYLECNEKYININKASSTYSWILKKMNERIPNTDNIKYPLWAWVKFKNGICPPKHKGEPVDGFEVKITFNKPNEEVFITDFRRYSFLLNNMYIPNNLKEKENFANELKENNITKEELKAFVRPDKYKTHRTDKLFLETCKKIENSFDRCITSDSDVLQGCVWRINLSEIEKIEILNDKNYTYGSFNYIRSNGKRFNWINDFYKKLI